MQRADRRPRFLRLPFVPPEAAPGQAGAWGPRVKATARAWGRPRQPTCSPGRDTSPATCCWLGRCPRTPCCLPLPPRCCFSFKREVNLQRLPLKEDSCHVSTPGWGRGASTKRCKRPTRKSSARGDQKQQLLPDPRTLTPPPQGGTDGQTAAPASEVALGQPGTGGRLAQRPAASGSDLRPFRSFSPPPAPSQRATASRRMPRAARTPRGGSTHSSSSQELPAKPFPFWLPASASCLQGKLLFIICYV